MIKLYRKGADKERKIVKEAKDSGLMAFRSAGSLGPIDVCIIDVLNHKIEFIQCKAGFFPDSQKKKLEEKYKFLNSTYFVTFEVR